MIVDNVIIEGSTYEEALRSGLKQLNLEENQVEVEILEEKKGFLFKKSFIKLKIFPIQNILENNSDKTRFPSKQEGLHLKYDIDGVYLNVYENYENGVSDILDFLNIKKVENVDYEKVIGSFSQNRGSYVLIAPSQNENLIDSTMAIEISRDKFEARILLSESFGGKVLTANDIISELNKKGIKYGIDTNAINDIFNNTILNQQVLIAKGSPAIDGINGKIIYNFDLGNENTTSVIDEEGKIDYKNLNRINNVTANTLLLEIVPPIEGTNGIDIYGNPVVAKQGTIINVKQGKNVYESEDGLKIFSSKDGEVHFSNGRIHVDEVKNIDGDVDNVTGNINFNGKVNIKGNVKSGFKVEADGDIEIFGVVESATLISKSNIIIHRGVQGNNQANINCEGDLTVKYLENANVICGGNIVSDAILHSNIVAKGKILVQGKKGLLAGGEIKTGNEVRANIIGSHMGTITKIEVGINPNDKSKFESLKYELSEVEKNIDSSQKAIELLNRMSKKQPLNSDKQELLIKSLKTYNVLKSKHDTISKSILELSEKFKDSNNGKVHALKVVYPGVRVAIGSNSKQIYDELSNCTLYLKDAEVTIGPYER